MLDRREGDRRWVDREAMQDEPDHCADQPGGCSGERAARAPSRMGSERRGANPDFEQGEVRGAPDTATNEELRETNDPYSGPLWTERSDGDAAR